MESNRRVNTCPMVTLGEGEPGLWPKLVLGEDQRLPAGLRVAMM
jgi:hypothetical protein